MEEERGRESGIPCLTIECYDCYLLVGCDLLGKILILSIGFHCIMENIFMCGVAHCSNGVCKLQFQNNPTINGFFFLINRIKF